MLLFHVSRLITVEDLENIILGRPYLQCLMSLETWEIDMWYWGGKNSLMWMLWYCDVNIERTKMKYLAAGCVN